MGIHPFPERVSSQRFERGLQHWAGKRGGAGGQEIALVSKGNEIEPMLARGSFDAETSVRHVAGDGRRDRSVSELLRLVAIDLRGSQSLCGEQSVEAQPRSRFRLAIDEA